MSRGYHALKKIKNYAGYALNRIAPKKILRAKEQDREDIVHARKEWKKIPAK